MGKSANEDQPKPQAAAADEEALAADRQRIETELARVRLEAAELELEDLKNRVGKQRLEKEERQHRQLAAQQSLDDANRAIIASQKGCRHRKGGRDKKGLVEGHDNNYAVIDHIYPWGERVRMCQRCMKEWRPPKAPDIALRKSDPGAYRKALEKYKVDLEEYKTALSWPTDNAPSGTQLFQFRQMSQEEIEARALEAAEV